ncbi:MAG: DNA-formamidopyrimidine glycosylase family protein [Sandaracinaceae bacterium]
MPEGDTIHRAAERLSAALVGQRIVRWYSDLAELMDARLADRVVTSVEARGKHLLITFDDGRALHTHMRMNGRWLVRPVGWPRRVGGRRVAQLETERHLVVCVDAPVCELVRAGRVPDEVARLGPDLLAPDVDLEEALRRLREHGSLPLGEALLRQDLVAGIGNVYKSEVLFLRRMDPFSRVADHDDDALRALLREARRQLRRNLHVPIRATRRRGSGAPLWVYRRSGEDCFKCGERIAMKRQGERARSTYYCASCQGSPRT